jgi:hypothetical protein
LPAVVAVLRRPTDGESGLRRSIGPNTREAIEDEAAREAAMLREWVALDFYVQCAAVVGPRARGGRERQCGYEAANCKMP